MTQFQKFLLMVEAIGDNATQEQAERLECWVVNNLARDEWASAAINAVSVGDFYTNMRMRMAECGEY